MRRVKRPNFFIYYFLLFFIGLFFIIKNRVHFDRKATKKIKGPALVIANHPSRPDFIYSLLALFHRRLNIVVARNYTYYRSLRRILEITSAIPKNLFNPDSSTVKSIMAIIKQGGVVLIMPEGRLSSNGSIGVMPEGIAKLVQKLEVPIINVHIDGGYLTGGKWITKRRRGRINVKTSVILTPKDIKALTLTEIKESILNNLSYNDFEWIKENKKIRFKGKALASGLDRILYVCPHCHEEFTLKTNKHQFQCTKCSFQVSLTNRYRFIASDNPVYFDNIYEWFEYQRSIIEQQLAHSDYTLETKVILKMPKKIKNKVLMKNTGEGICTLSKQGLSYKGMIDGAYVEKFFPISVMATLLFGCDEDFEIYYENHFYYFEPITNRKQVVKWSIFTEVAYQLSLQKEKQDETLL